MLRAMSVAALVLAAGRGERFGSELPKAFAQLAGRPILVRALAALAATPEIGRVQPVVAAAELPRLAALAGLLAAIPKLAPAVAGGAARQDSMRAGLAALPLQVRFVAVHDAARPLVRPADVSRVVAAARAHGAAILATRATDTVKQVRGGIVVATPPREECWVAQTPQVFRVELLREALAKAEADGVNATDDAQLVERLEIPVHVVEGDPSNFKITRRADLLRAEAWLAAAGEGG